VSAGGRSAPLAYAAPNEVEDDRQAKYGNDRDPRPCWAASAVLLASGALLIHTPLSPHLESTIRRHRVSRLTRNARSETLFGTGSQTGAALAPDARLVLDRLGEWLNTVSPTVARSGRETQR
jgi:hypothetical protein